MDKKTLILLGLAVTILAGSFSSCKKNNISYEEMRRDEIELREKYVAKFLPEIVPTESGLYYQEEEAGPITDSSKDTISTGDIVKVYYEGYLIEETDTAGIQKGIQFDGSGYYEPFSFTVGAGSVIQGWDEAIRLMREGSKAWIVVPSRLAYGNSQTAPGGPYSTLVFYIEVYKVIKSDYQPPEITRTDNGPWL